MLLYLYNNLRGVDTTIGEALEGELFLLTLLVFNPVSALTFPFILMILGIIGSDLLCGILIYFIASICGLILIGREFGDTLASGFAKIGLLIYFVLEVIYFACFGTVYSLSL